MNALHLKRPHAIMLVGIPGSGKSIFADRFSGMFSVPYIDIAEIQKHVSEGASTEGVTLYVLEQLMKSRQTYLFEGNSASRSSRTEFAKWARAHDYQPMFLWVQTSQDESYKRVQKLRKLTRQQFTDSLANFSPPHPDEKAVVISGKHTYASQARVVLEVLGRNNRLDEPSPKASETERPSAKTPAQRRNKRLAIS